MACRMCEERGKDWSGSAPVCYFDDSRGNWNCATVNAIRDICDGSQEMPRGVVLMHWEDENFALINVWECDFGDDEEFIGCLYVQWYKRRGRTERLLLLGEETNREPTEKELLVIIEYYKGVLGWNGGKY